MTMTAVPRKPRQIDQCPHTDRPHYAGGMCKVCYYKARQDAGLYDRKAADQAYEQSDAGRERQTDYNQSEAGRERKRRWKKRQKKGAAPQSPPPPPTGEV